MRLLEIDASNRWQHKRLDDGDICYHLFEYTSHHGGDARTNQLIRNLKKKPSLKDKPGYIYKERAIEHCASAFRDALDADWISKTTFVPIPCSKAANHPDYDDRMERLCRAIAPGIEVRPLITQRYTTRAAHESSKGERITEDKLVRMYEVDLDALEPTPRSVAIVDDVLTSGTHFKAVQKKLRQRWPDVPIVGIFIARRIFAPGQRNG